MTGDPALETAEAAALRAIYLGLPEGRVVEVGPWTVRSWPQRPRSPWMHQVVAGAEPVTAGALAGALEAALDDALDQLGGLPVLVQLPDQALPAEVLTGRGFGDPVRQLRLVAPAGGPAPGSGPAPGGGLVLEAVGPPGGGDVSAVLRTGFGFDEPWWWVAPLGSPGWTQVVAYDGDTPVATGALHVAGDVAWAGAASTVPSARGRGAQAVLLAHRLRLAAELGASQVTAKTAPGSASHRNLVRVGFVPSYEVVQWSRGQDSSRRRPVVAPGRT